jgi:prophage DNA circulation protein
MASFGIIKMPSVPWRDALLPASFRGALFHVEAGAKESGRRIVVHEFPKKDVPYSEDMGRRVRTFTVRGYCITFPVETGITLYSRDYRIARDALINELEAIDPGVLQLPTIDPITVVCPQYRWTEEEKIGGFCTFDMTFVEYGAAPGIQDFSSTDALRAASLAAKARIVQVMSGLEQQTAILAAHAPVLIPRPGGGQP